MRVRRDSLLVGPRVELRALTGADYAAWRDVRVRSRDWLEPWEPLPDPGTPDPVVDTEAFRARCGAWDRQRHFDTAYGFGLFLRDGSLVGEVSLGSVLRGPFQSAFIGYWVDAAHAGQGFVPEGVVLLIRYGFEELGLRDEGTAARFLQIRGVWEDHVRYAITLEEWMARKQELEQAFLS